ncbi:MAG TPA: M20/M25/M40 family metallo-hydrolase [Armatimonadota bacterium]|jgi:acetylornithine deacetylase/succinyl-diaminopimelate desuccinylase-like protein
MMDKLTALLDANRQQYLSWFLDYLRVPSLAGQRVGVEEGAEATRAMMERAGLRAEVWRLPGAAPVVFGEAGEGPRTLLVYDHYDVQPAEPLDLWETPPFEPSIRGGKLYARGTSDNRGEVAARLAALHAWRDARGALPVRVKMLVEGEEEVGSPNLAWYVDAFRERLEADGVLWEGGEWDEGERLNFPLGGKGLAYFDLSVEGPSHDLHSANAAIVENPAWRLVRALDTLRDGDGQVIVDGLREAVRPVTELDDALLESTPLDVDAVRKNLGVDHLLDDDIRRLKRRRTFGPTCNICGISAGYSGAGPKTVLPARASAKLDFRLVPDLTPDLVHRLLREHLNRRGFTDVQVDLLSGIRPSRSPADSLIARACLAAARSVSERPAYLTPMAPYSGPFHLFADELGIPLCSAGCVSYEGSRAHSPNENVRVDDWFAGIRFIASLIEEFAGA